MDSPSLKDTKEGASALAAGREFHKGTVRGLYLKQSVEENCLYFLMCDDLVLAAMVSNILQMGDHFGLGPLYNRG